MKKIFLFVVAAIAFATQTTAVSAQSITEVDAVLANGKYIVEFKIEEAVDLSLSTDDITIQYFYEFDDGVRAPIVNKTTNQPLVKNKGWDGYLYDQVAHVNYSQGEIGNAAYLDLIPAGAVLATMIDPTHSSVMDYVSVDWDQGKIVAVITVKTATGEVTLEASDGAPLVNPSPVDPIIPTLPTEVNPAPKDGAVKQNPPTGDIDMGRTIAIIASSAVLIGAAIVVLKKQVLQNK